MKNKKQLYQQVRRYIGTNAQYYFNKEHDKLYTSGAYFVIISPEDKSEHENANNCILFVRGDESLTLAQMKKAVKSYKGILLTDSE